MHDQPATHDPMHDGSDDPLRRAYREAAAQEDARPSPQARAAVLAAAARAVHAGPRPLDAPRSRLTRYRVPLALAASLLVGTVAWQMAAQMDTQRAVEGTTMTEATPAVPARGAATPSTAVADAAPPAPTASAPAPAAVVSGAVSSDATADAATAGARGAAPAPDTAGGGSSARIDGARAAAPDAARSAAPAGARDTTATREAPAASAPPPASAALRAAPAPESAAASSEAARAAPSADAMPSSARGAVAPAATPAPATRSAAVPSAPAPQAAPMMAPMPAPPPPPPAPSRNADVAAPAQRAAPRAEEHVRTQPVERRRFDDSSDARGVRPLDAWLRQIAELRAAGRDAEADDELARLRRAYPDAVIPPALQSPAAR